MHLAEPAMPPGIQDALQVVHLCLRVLMSKPSGIVGMLGATAEEHDHRSDLSSQLLEAHGQHAKTTMAITKPIKT